MVEKHCRNNEKMSRQKISRNHEETLYSCRNIQFLCCNPTKGRSDKSLSRHINYLSQHKGEDEGGMSRYSKDCCDTSRTEVIIVCCDISKIFIDNT